MKKRPAYRERLKRNPAYQAAREDFMKRWPDYPHGVWTEELVQSLEKFVTEWGMAPIDPASRDFFKDPLFYYQQVGKDGAFLIRIYPWTLEEEVVGEFRRIRREHQPQAPLAADGETVRKVMDLVSRGMDFDEVGRRVFRDTLDERGRLELLVDERFLHLLEIEILGAEDASPAKARERALARLAKEEVYQRLGAAGYRPGDLSRALEHKVVSIYELLKSGLE